MVELDGVDAVLSCTTLCVPPYASQPQALIFRFPVVSVDRQTAAVGLRAGSASCCRNVRLSSPPEAPFVFDIDCAAFDVKVRRNTRCNRHRHDRD